MEQRIGPSSQPLKAEPVTGAGFDPAFIPGITPPAPAAEPQEGDPAGTAQPADPEDAAGPAAEPAGAAREPGREADPEGAAEEDQEAGGPVFEAADRRARIVADRRGVRLSLDEEACEFRWSEIAAVETASPRFGKRFTITVYTPENRWYPIEIEASSRSRLTEWDTQLDAVLDAYFEEA